MADNRNMTIAWPALLLSLALPPTQADPVAPAKRLEVLALQAALEAKGFSPGLLLEPVSSTLRVENLSIWTHGLNG